MNDLWRDYKYVLMPGKVSEPILFANRKPHPELCPYTETHKCEKGIVFFPEERVAQVYLARFLDKNYTICNTFPHSGGLVFKSVKHWGCNVAFSIRIDNGHFVRDVTAMSPDMITDGQHRHSGE